MLKFIEAEIQRWRCAFRHRETAEGIATRICDQTPGIPYAEALDYVRKRYIRITAPRYL